MDGGRKLSTAAAAAPLPSRALYNSTSHLINTSHAGCCATHCTLRPCSTLSASFYSSPYLCGISYATNILPSAFSTHLMRVSYGRGHCMGMELARTSHATMAGALALTRACTRRGARGRTVSGDPGRPVPVDALALYLATSDDTLVCIFHLPLLNRHYLLRQSLPQPGRITARIATRCFLARRRARVIRACRSTYVVPSSMSCVNVSAFYLPILSLAYYRQRGSSLSISHYISSRQRTPSA